MEKELPYRHPADALGPRANEEAMQAEIEDAVGALRRSVIRGVKLPHVAERYFARDPSALHGALDALAKDKPSNPDVIQNIETLKADYPIE